MQIDHPEIFSYQPMSLLDYLISCDQIDGDMNMAYSLAEDGRISNQVLVLSMDPYGECNDRHIEYEGKKYIWGMDTYTMQDVVRSFRKLFPDRDESEVVVAAHYYIINDAFILPKYWESFVEGQKYR